MKARQFLGAFGLGLTFTVCLELASPKTPFAAPAKPRAERPTYTLGEKWVRDDGTYELVRIEADRYVFEAQNNWIELTKDLAVAKIRRGRDIWECTPVSLTWPLEVGQRGSSVGILREPNKVTRSVTITWSVEAYQAVRVRAGTFQAFEIEVVLSEGSPHSQTTRFRMWYAPEARQYVRSEDLSGPEPSTRHTFEVVAIEKTGNPRVQVVISEPDDHARATTPSLPLKGKVTAEKAIMQVVVTLNGREVARQDAQPGAARREVPLAVKLPLQAGENVLLVTATDSVGGIGQGSRTLFYDPPALSFQTPLSSSQATKARAERPTYTLGEKWHRDDGTYELVRIDEDRYVFTAEPDHEIHLTKDLAIAKVRQGQSVWECAQVQLAWPLEVGKSGTSHGSLTRSRGGAPESVDITWNVQAYEPARVAAGTFDAFRIEMEFRITMSRTIVGRFRFWYAPEARQYVKAEFTGYADPALQALHTFQLRVLDRPTPLQIAMPALVDQARVASTSLPLQGTVIGDKGIAHVTITLNGQEVARYDAPPGAAPREVPLTATLPLQPGANVLVVTATDPAGTTTQATRTVVYDQPAPPRVARRPANRWAVVVGVGRHDHPQIPRLRYSVPDAEAIHRVLIGPGGFKPEHVLLLTDTTERKPTLRNLKWALGTFLARAAQKDDTVLIFFAGHGAPEVDQRGVERDGLAKYLIPSDADPDDLYATALPMDELQTIFARLEAERVVVLLDTCYSGAAGGRTFASLRTRAVTVDDLFLERLARTKGRAIITASRPNEVSLEMAELGHGLFTYYLLQGLGGQADLNRDRIVSLQELYEYVESEVVRTSRAHGGNQHPVLKGELEGVLPLVTVR